MRAACRAQAWLPMDQRQPYIWSTGLQWLHRLICAHTWHTDRTHVTLCVCCLKARTR